MNQRWWAKRWVTLTLGKAAAPCLQVFPSALSSQRGGILWASLRGAKALPRPPGVCLLGNSQVYSSWQLGWTLPTSAEGEGVSPGLGLGLRERGSFLIGCCREGGQFSDGRLLSLAGEVGSSTGRKLKWGKKQLSL